jgi:hypothetical protein
MLRTPAIRAGIRTAVAVAAVYAMLFNALLAAAAPLVPTPSMGGIICVEHAGGSDQPVPSGPSHANLCCIAVCSATAAAVLPSDYSPVTLGRASTSTGVEASLATLAPSPPPNAQASPRGPPILL